MDMACSLLQTKDWFVREWGMGKWVGIRKKIERERERDDRDAKFGDFAGRFCFRLLMGESSIVV